MMTVKLSREAEGITHRVMMRAIETASHSGMLVIYDRLQGQIGGRGSHHTWYYPTLRDAHRALEAYVRFLGKGYRVERRQGE